MLQKHADSSNKFQQQVLVDIAIIKTKSEATGESLENHQKDIEKLKDKARESSIVVKALSAVGLAGIVEYIRQHLS